MIAEEHLSYANQLSCGLMYRINNKNLSEEKEKEPMKWHSSTPGPREMTQIVIHEANLSPNTTEPHIKGVMNKNSSCHPQQSKNMVVGRDFFFMDLTGDIPSVCQSTGACLFYHTK